LKALNPVEWNYEIHNTKMLPIIRGLKKWRHYLEGAHHPWDILQEVQCSLCNDTQEESVRGHPSVSLLPLSSPTLPLFICIPSPPSPGITLKGQRPSHS
jgi:hypothetical protein